MGLRKSLSQLRKTMDQRRLAEQAARLGNRCGNVGRGQVRLGGAVVGPTLDGDEIQRMVGILEQLIAQATGLVAAGGDQRLENLPELGRGIGGR